MFFQIPATLAHVDDLERYTQLSSHPLHKTNKSGILSVDIHSSKVQFLTLNSLWCSLIFHIQCFKLSITDYINCMHKFLIFLTCNTWEVCSQPLDVVVMILHDTIIQKGWDWIPIDNFFFHLPFWQKTWHTYILNSHFFFSYLYIFASIRTLISQVFNLQMYYTTFPCMLQLAMQGRSHIGVTCSGCYTVILAKSIYLCTNGLSLINPQQASRTTSKFQYSSLTTLTTLLKYWDIKFFIKETYVLFPTDLGLNISPFLKKTLQNK